MEQKQNNKNRQNPLEVNQSTVNQFIKGRKTSKKVDDYIYKIIGNDHRTTWKMKIRSSRHLNI